MKVIFILLFVFLLSGLTNYSFSQKVGVESVSTKELKGYLEFLSSDSLQGRSIGTDVPGLEIAAGYIANKAKLIGLKPGYTDYFQPVQLISSKQNQDNSKLIIKNSEGEIVLKTDSVISFNKEKEKLQIESEIVFCGFGWEDSITGYNDFKGISLDGKIAMYVNGSPESFKEEMSGKTIRFNNSLELAKRDRIFKKGAKAVILLNSPLNSNASNYSRIYNYMQRSSYSVQNSSSENEDIMVLTPPSVYDVIAGEQGALKAELERMIKNDTDKKDITEGFFADVSIINDVTKYPGKNVVGFIEGSDTELKDECIVFMAHYDHLGMDANGDVFNGADDNGSGSVTLLELAKAFNTLEKKPKRSIVFLWVTCEELGMLGSHYYTDNPLFPLDKTKVCINLDMVGRVYEKRDDVWKKSPKLVKDFNGLYCLMGNETENLVEINDSVFKKVGLIPDKSLPPQFLRSSDHYYFYSNGVPIINYATGYHADYHKVTDEVSKINFKKMKKVAELCFYVGYEIANQ
ncbi:MAG: M28 family peptidase [Prolixibacteraceae bacterium]|nr:M28 family peptidase [Prolixibacteraceae bacterium]MBN2772781.1 M28 family peptidase [Prolixibacteraceae bacterium]